MKEEQDPLKIENCPKCLKKIKNLKRHMMIHSGEKPHVCNFCRMTFNQRNILKSHLLIHTGEKPFKCDVCEQCFNQSSNLKRHKGRHHLTNPKRGRTHKCEFCLVTFRSCTNLQSHRKSHTLLGLTESDNFTISCESGRCKTKGKTSTDEKEQTNKIGSTKSCVWNFFETTRNKTIFKCIICRNRSIIKFIKTSNVTFLKLHIGKKHKEVFNKIQDEDFKRNIIKSKWTIKIHKCNLCSKQVSSSFMLKEHMNMHSGEKPYKCEECEKEFHGKKII